MFVNTLFSFFEATGMETFDEMVINRLKSAERIIASMKNLPKEKQTEMKSVMGGLLQSSSKVIKKT